MHVACKKVNSKPFNRQPAYQANLKMVTVCGCFLINLVTHLFKKRYAFSSFIC